MRGSLPGIDVRADQPALVFTSFGTEFTDTPYWSDRKALAIRLLVLLAAESPVVCVRSIHRNKKPLNEGIARRIPVSIAEPIVDPLARIEILKEMYAGVPITDRKKVLTISDRKEAIKTACTLAQKGDIILLAGKGHEKYQEISGVKHPFDDKAVLREMFEELGK